MQDLQRRQNDISDICIMLLQCKPGGLVSSIIQLYAKIGALDPSNNRNRCLGCSRTFKPPC